MHSPETADFVKFAHRLADAAAEVTLAHFRVATPVDNKAAGGRFDPVTAADRGAEAAVRALIEARYPDHGIQGEEEAARPAAGRHTWFIDPIDGTRSFIMGVPLWGTLIGLEDDGRPVVGVIDQPYIGERFTGSPAGASLASRAGTAAISTSGCTDLAAARLGTTSPHLFAPGAERDGYRALEARVRQARYGGDCYFYALLAAGHVDLVVEAGLHPFDVVALIPVVEAAGGVITTWAGDSAHRGGQVIAAATPELHDAARAVLRGQHLG